MNKHFIVSRRPAPGVEAAVFATCALNPMEEIGAIERDLRKKKVAGRVFFDLLLAHGNKTNRYFVGEFDGQHFTSPRFQRAESEYEAYSKASASILREHLPEVDASLLSNAMRFALREGIPF
ncbi:MAG: type II toxin-antitoxin system RnlB family antitoxin [Betaproteobacteria bacterium]|nr:type II toxin-antitoxin system RnlB family antitoxin [Betaproteobacteria bacterium]